LEPCDRQVHCHLSHTSSPFGFSYFSGRLLYFLPGPASDCDLPTYASCIAGITGVHHYTWLVFGVGGLADILPGLANNYDPSDLCLLNSWDYRCALPLALLCIVMAEGFGGFLAMSTHRLILRTSVRGTLGCWNVYSCVSALSLSLVFQYSKEGIGACGMSVHICV
jgi:hypothetical protein